MANEKEVADEGVSPQTRQRQKMGTLAEGDDQMKLQQQMVEKHEAAVKEKEAREKFATGAPRGEPLGDATGIDPMERREGGTLGAVLAEEGLLPDEPKEPKKETGAEGAEAEDDELEGHTVEELRQIAASEGVDLAGATLKADIVAAIAAKRAS